MIKITIEGWEDEPVVMEGIEQFLLITETENIRKVQGHVNPAFLSYCSITTKIKAEDAIRNQGAG